MKKIGRFFLLLTFLFLHSNEALAKTIEVTAQVDTTEVRVGEEIDFQIIVGTNDVREPDLSQLEKDFEVYSKGASSKIEIINLKRSFKRIFNYILVPLRQGRVEIPNISVVAEGDTYKTNRIVLSVLNSSSQQRSKQDSLENENIFVVSEVDKQNPYLGEQIIYTYRFFRRRDVSLQGANLENLEFNHMWVEDIGKQREYVKLVNGIPYVVIEIKKALFPNKSGSIEIPSFSLTANVVIKETRSRRRSRGFFDDSLFDDFFPSGRLVKRVFSTKPIQINVKELPPGGGGKKLVGKFNISSEVSQKVAMQGDSITLTLTISGEGNIRDASDYNLESNELYKVYDDKPELSVFESAGKVSGKKIIKKAIVPIKKGVIQIDPFEIVYFNPETDKWEKNKSNEIQIKIKEGDGGDNLEILTSNSIKPQKKQIQLIGKDIIPIKTKIEFLAFYRMSTFYYVLSFLLVLLPGAIYIVIYLLNKNSIAMRTNRKLKRKSIAIKSFRRSYKKAFKRRDSQSLECCLKEFLGNTYNVNPFATTTLGFRDLMQKDDIDEKVIDTAVSTLEALDAAKYGATGIDENNIKNYLNNLNIIMVALKKRYRL